MSTFAVTGGHRHTAPKSGNTMHKWVISGGIALLIISAFLALASGPVLSDWRLAFAWWWPSTFDGISDLHLRIVFEIRIPRFMLGALVGCVLAQAGTAMQTLCRNPLADPGLIGVSSGAAVAALAVIALGGQIGLSGAGWVTAAAFAGALTATWLVYVIASGNNGTQVATLLLAGVAINALAGALIGLLSYHADDDALRLMTFWQMGSLAGASWPQLWVGCACLLFACLMLS
ncbi:MAG TPA: iron chelate uptake ABC transporter family permease subunit, partial [Marinagarivorans sp.]